MSWWLFVENVFWIAIQTILKDEKVLLKYLGKCFYRQHFFFFFY